MAGQEIGYFRGTGGAIHRMALPLSKVMAGQVTRQELRRVNADGSPYREAGQEAEQQPAETGSAAGDGTGQGDAGGDTDPPPPAGTARPEPPARNAATGAWRTWATQHGGLTAEQAGQLSRDELIELLTPPGE